MVGLGRRLLLQLVLIDKLVQRPHQIEQLADRAARVEVVVQLREERRAAGMRLLGQFIGARIELAGRSARHGGQFVELLAGHPRVAFEETMERVEPRAGLGHFLFAEHDRAAVMRSQEEKPQPVAALAADEVGKPARAFRTADLRVDGRLFLGRGGARRASSWRAGTRRAGSRRVAVRFAADFAACRTGPHQAVVQPVFHHRLMVA